MIDMSAVLSSSTLIIKSSMIFIKHAQTSATIWEPFKLNTRATLMDKHVMLL